MTVTTIRQEQPSDHPAVEARAHAEARSLGHKSIVLLGHPSYYPRFGYQRASTWNITAPFDVPDEAFMAVELVPHGLKGVSGVVEYSKPFTEA